MLSADIIIGKGTPGNTAITIVNYPKISENKNCYHISRISEVNISILIFKDTELGKLLKTMIDNKITTETIYETIERVGLKEIEPHVLKIKIHDFGIYKFYEGEESKLKEIQKVLKIPTISTTGYDDE